MLKRSQTPRLRYQLHKGVSPGYFQDWAGTLGCLEAPTVADGISRRDLSCDESRGPAGEKARRILQEELDKLGWTTKDLEARSKGDVRKVRLARRLRTETSVTWKWISAQLHMGTWTHAASLKLKIEPDEQNEFKLE